MTPMLLTLLACAEHEVKYPYDSGAPFVDSGEPCVPEVCDGADNDCDGSVDEDVQSTWYPDDDGDGYGRDADAVLACDAPLAHAPVGGDCLDDAPDVHPGAPEDCDDVDEDCDGLVDEDLSFESGYPDADGDGYGAEVEAVLVCLGTPGVAAVTGDCDDAAPAVNPAAEEWCWDGVDNDCDGTADRCQRTTEDALASRRGETGYAFSGYAAAGLGDTNGDGYDDIAIGSMYEDFGLVELGYIGAVYVEQGPITGDESVAVAQTRIRGDEDDKSIGTSVTGPGDMDGDGLADLLVAAALARYQPGSYGGVYLFLSGPTGELGVADADATIRYAPGTNDQPPLGDAIAGVGDVDGDGWRDIAIGAPGVWAPSSPGAFYLYAGPVSGDLTQSDATIAIHGGASGDLLGISVSGGDLDGDGLDDLVVGAAGESTVVPEAGAVYVFYGGGSVAAVADADHTLYGEATEQYVGLHSAVTEDLDGDGLRDLLVGAPGTHMYAVLGGAVYVFHALVGTSSSVGASDAQIYGNGADDYVSPAAAVGDLDGDGGSELVIGRATYYWNAGTGGAWLIPGDILGTYDLAAAPVTYRDPYGEPEALGYIVTSAGDVDADGYRDLLVTDPAELDPAGESMQGMTYLFDGAGL